MIDPLTPILTLDDVRAMRLALYEAERAVEQATRHAQVLRERFEAALRFVPPAQRTEFLHES